MFKIFSDKKHANLSNGGLFLVLSLDFKLKPKKPKEKRFPVLRLKPTQIFP